LSGNTNHIVDELKARAEKLGFVAFGVAKADLPSHISQAFLKALDENWHGDMEWMKTSADRRLSPQNMWPDARSAIVVAYNYAPDENPMVGLKETDKGVISVYARNRDYHEIIKGKLKELANICARRTNAEVKVFVDTAPLLEKPLAQQAGIGWQGKHSVLVNKREGCWLFLGTILTSADLPADEAENDHCGSCTRCLDICPTNAFPEPYKLDARRCIAYLTNEYKGVIPVEFRKPIGNRIYGCDDCLAVCPWNKFATEAADVKLRMREDLRAPKLSELAKLDDAGFRTFFAGSPVKRLGRNAFLRNVLIGIGNAENIDIDADIIPHLQDQDPVVRGAAVWAYKQHASHADFETKKHQALAHEKEQSVIKEWQGTAE
jgi:epoxyqueuosine reductase